MSDVHLTVSPHGRLWKLSGEQLQLGFFETRETAIHAGKQAVDQARRDGLHAGLQVLDVYGELSQVDLGGRNETAELTH